jgi:hypothetical protein
VVDLGAVPDMVPEEHERRGDAAEALFRELTRRVRGEMTPPGPPWRCYGDHPLPDRCDALAAQTAGVSVVVFTDRMRDIRARTISLERRI